MSCTPVLAQVHVTTLREPVSKSYRKWDRTFALTRDAKARAEDAAVRPNRRARTMTGRAEIRSKGLATGFPGDTRRLGDLRLEGEVGMAAELVSNRTAFERMADALMGLEGYCARPTNNYLFFAERPLFSVTLVAGARREVLPAERGKSTSPRGSRAKAAGLCLTPAGAEPTM